MNMLRLRWILLLALCFLAVAKPLAQADDIIANGDFADGKTHWHGDGDAPDTGGKLVITLKPDKWTVTSQIFSAESRELQLKITYTLSDDCSLKVKRTSDTLVAPLTSEALMDATGVENHISDVMMYPNYQWLVLLVGNGYSRGTHPVLINTKENPATYTTMLSDSRGFNDEELCLAFPPGTGTVTITRVEMIAPPGTGTQN
jgi:hypothetical protein